MCIHAISNPKTKPGKYESSRPKHSLPLPWWVSALSSQHPFGKFPGMWFGGHSPHPTRVQCASSSSLLQTYIFSNAHWRQAGPSMHVQPFNEAAQTSFQAPWLKHGFKRVEMIEDVHMGLALLYCHQYSTNLPSWTVWQQCNAWFFSLIDVICVHDLWPDCVFCKHPHQLLRGAGPEQSTSSRHILCCLKIRHVIDCVKAIWWIWQRWMQEPLLLVAGELLLVLLKSGGRFPIPES